MRGADAIPVPKDTAAKKEWGSGSAYQDVDWVDFFLRSPATWWKWWCKLLTRAYHLQNTPLTV